VSIAPQVQLVPPHFSYPFVTLATMHTGVAFRAERDQAFLCVGSRMAAAPLFCTSRLDIVPHD